MLNACGQTPSNDKIIGMTKAEVRERFGEPTRMASFTRKGGPNTDIGFGPPLECDYFRDLPAGSVVKVWYYDLEPSEGWLRECHFVQGTDAVVWHQYLEEKIVY
jgi:hypothetical protein